MHLVTYPSSGLLRPHSHFERRRNDQGADIVIGWKGIIQAPGDWECVEVRSDAAFPDGFGPSFPIVQFTTGAYASRLAWYIGHCTSLVHVGERGAFGAALATADQGHDFEGTHGGWVEFGQRQPDGRLGPYNPNGHWFDPLLVKPLRVWQSNPTLRFGDSGPRVLTLSAQLRDCGYLSRRWWHFNRQVHGAVVRFRDHHHIPTADHDKGSAGDRLQTALAASAHWCRVHHRKETGP